MTRKRHEHFKITKLARRYDREAGKLTFTIAYETSTEITPRTIAVAEAFGLGVDQTQKFVLYDSVELKIGPEDIVYITGDSGSGKSVLLKTIKNDLEEAGEQVTDMTEVDIEPDKPLIDTVGKDLSEGLKLLSRSGLNDAFLFIRRFRELSDGQKYRYKIAKLMESGKQWWIADEFCSTLDRPTAKIVAFNIQKLARKSGKAVIVATTHTDLSEDLKPSVHIHKRFGKEIVVNYHPDEPAKQCSLVKQMKLVEGTTQDWRRLAGFHYRSHRIAAPRKIYCLKREDELCGVIVYCYPPAACFGRRMVMPKMSMKELNEKLSVISRVIVHPKYRTIGLGAKLVRETLPLTGTPYVEMVAVMAKHNPFGERAGMQKITESKPNPNLLHTIEQLRALGFNPVTLRSINHNVQKIRLAGKDKVTKILEELSRKEGALRKRLMSSNRAYPKHEEFAEKMRTVDEKGLATILKRINFLAQTKVYLFWKHPEKLGKKPEIQAEKPEKT